MSINIRLFDHTNIHQLEWPNSEEAKQAKALLLPMLQEGVQAFIRNVKTKLYLMQVNSTLIPITVNTKGYNNSYLTSNFFPIKYLEESLHRKMPRLYRLQSPFVKCLGLLLKGIKINKVVIVNNWLLTTNIYPRVTEEEIKEITNFLKRRFQDHVLIFRSLNACKCSELTKKLESEQYRLLFSRNVFIYDPDQKGNFSSKVLYHHRRDRRLLGSEGYELVRNKQLSVEDIPNILSLYNELYVSSHTKYSPQYTEKFLRLAVKNNYLHLVGLKKAGKIHGVIGFHERGDTLITPFCGFDQTKNDSNNLYRMLTMLAIDEAEQRACILNDGSGGSAPKKYRGMKPVPEFIALYDRHLPKYRRLFWALAEKAVKRFILPKFNDV